MAWRLWPQLNDLYYRRSSEYFVFSPSGGIELTANLKAEVTLPLGGGGMAMGGTVVQDVETAVSGGMAMGGTAAREGESTLTPSGGMAMGGTVAREGESVLVPSGGMALGGSVPVTYPFHYGWWPSDGFWPSSGWWWDAIYSYEQQGEDS